MHLCPYRGGLSSSIFYVQLEHLCAKHRYVFANACHFKCSFQSSGTQDPRSYGRISVKVQMDSSPEISQL